jgi:hypothetical protein
MVAAAAAIGDSHLARSGGPPSLLTSEIAGGHTIVAVDKKPLATLRDSGNLSLAAAS